MKNQIVKPSILPGFMELLPSDQILFNKILDTIKNNYEGFGFIPMDTPIIEKSEILLAKGGGETTKQIYRFNKGKNDISLRFDLTVPFARYVSQYSQDLTFPLRRYQIGKVFRGERNQKGRFREFYQCDIDIINRGKLNIINDAEIPSIIYSVFKELDIDSFTIYINNRKLLNGYFEYLKIKNKEEVLRTIDKLDKIGEDQVKEELKLLCIENEVIEKLLKFIKINGDNNEILTKLKNLGVENELFQEGLNELEKVVYYIGCFKVPKEFYNINLKIARGLDYYTGTVYETMLNDYLNIGSICSGGRYDDLAQNYTTEKLSGVGISIGLTRLFYQLKEANLLKMDSSSTTSQVIVVPMDTEYINESIHLVNELRNKKVRSELYLEENKLGKKLNYANKLEVSYIVLVGKEEVETGFFTLKDMKTGSQNKFSMKEIIEVLNKR
ncbi:histidine--tRNA ligase [Inediibacterium massiliense]|uniref:histidine--tRNA ligase n=1 Tax=Inediibacterium massiliense TaxID=1658111 RepID=UPI0006B41DDE|nr:histidine--tRNA ligase [Inediibacterium massiliense]